MLIAHRLEEQRQSATGHVSAIDLEKRTLKLSRGAFGKTFHLADDCTLVTRSGETDKLAELKKGQRVSVVYEEAKGVTLARRIEQTSATFTGTISAIDLTTDTVKVKSMLGHKTFDLARGCRIILNGEKEGALADLRIGQPVTVQYDEVDGVNVTYRLAQETAAKPGSREKSPVTTVQKNEE